MKADVFEKLVRKRLNHCLKTLTLKGDEYSRNGDRLWNFKRAAAIQGTTPEKALLGMLAKHWVSLMDMLESPETVSEEMLNEKIDDNINYMLLSEGLITERMTGGTKPKMEHHFKNIPEIMTAMFGAVEGMPDPDDDDYERMNE